MSEVRRQRWLALLLAERERRQDDSGYADGARERLLTELGEMGRRWLAVTPPRSSPEKAAALAVELAQAENWERVDEIRAAPDLSAAECVALALAVDPAAGLRLLGEYSHMR